MSVLNAMADAFKKGGIQAAYNFSGFYSHELFSHLGGVVTSTNEKIAYEIAWGQSQAGQPTLVTFKNVGLNDAADPFINSYFTGVGAGLVVVVFDDIELAGSQIILDSRNYWYHAGGLWLEPFDWHSACLLAHVAPKLSEFFNIPVVIRLTNASLRFTELDSQPLDITSSEVAAMAQKYASDLSNTPSEPLVHPANGEEHRAVLTRKNKAIAAFVQELHQAVNPSGATGEAFAGYSSPKAASHIISLPAPITTAITAMHEIGDPVIARELQLQTSTTTLKSDTIGYNSANKSRVIVAERYERLFGLLKPHFTYIAGDLGEYTKDTLSTLTHCLCFGSAISVSMGMLAAGKTALAITGDGSFYHSGKNALAEAHQRNVAVHVVLLDNGGMQGTGGQQVPGEIPDGYTRIACNLAEDSDQQLAAVVQKFRDTPSQVILHVMV